jgi:hypothetical protein
VTGNGEDWERGFSSWICFFLLFFSKETGLAGYLSTNGLGPLGLFGRGFLEFWVV